MVIIIALFLFSFSLPAREKKAIQLNCSLRKTALEKKGNLLNQWFVLLTIGFLVSKKAMDSNRRGYATENAGFQSL